MSMEPTLCSVRISSMKKKALPAGRKGRPPSEMAASHSAIMDAVYTLLQKKSVRDLTIEEVAKRARVGKPTLYKWWRPRQPWCWLCSASGWLPTWRSRRF